MRRAHDTGEASARERARRVGRRRGLAAAAVACAVQVAALQWGLPAAVDPSPDAPWPLRSMLSLERWPAGELPADKYPEAWHLVAGAVERVAAQIVLDEAQREAISRLRDRLAEEQRVHAGAPGHEPARALLELDAGLVRALGRLVLAGRLATLALAFLLSLAATEVAIARVSPRFGWIAGLTLGLMPATVHYAATLNADVPALAWCALAWALAVNGARGGAVAPFLACGAAMGLAAATKDQAAAVLPGVLVFALELRRGDPMTRGRRLRWIAAGAAAAYLLTSGILHWPTWRDHVRFVFGEGSQPYRQFPFTAGGVAGLLRATGDRFLAAGGLVGGAGILLLPATAALRARARPLRLLLPAAGCVALFIVPAGYVYPRFTLPVALSAAVALAWSLAHVAGAPGGRARRIWLGGLVAVWSLGEASGVIEAKRDDVRPDAVGMLAARRAPGDLAWVCAQPWFFAPFPPIPPPLRVLTLAEIGAALERGEPRPRFLWLAVDPRAPLAARQALEALGRERLGMRLVERFDSAPRAPLAREPDGLLLPTVALFEAEAR